MMKRLIIIFLLSGGLNVGFSQQKSIEYQQLTDQLATGWNTWNYYSMLSYVKLPESLMLNLNLRPAVQGTPYDPDYFYDNVTVDKTDIIHPKAHSVDGSYTHIRIDSWKDKVLDIKTAAVHNDIFILINPLHRSPTRYFVELETGILWNKEGVVQNNQEHISAQFGSTNYQIRSTKKSTEIARPYSAPYQSFLADSLFAIYTGSFKTLEEVILIIEEAERQYRLQSEKYDALADAHEAVKTVLGWNTLYDADLDRVITPVSRGWNEAWQGFVLFEWDTYFAALLSGLHNKELAYSNALAITKPINQFGAVAFTQQPRMQLADNSQPPVGSMVCWLLYEKYNDRWFLEQVFDELLSWNRWWVKNRRNGKYLTWGASWQGASEQDARWESGLDNSPMYDEVKIDTVGANSLLNLADVGLNSLYVADCQYLSKMAEVLGKKEEAKELKWREKEFTQAVQTLWSDKHGIFLNKYLDTGQFSERLSPTLFYPMMAGIPTKAQAVRMFEEHFYNEDEFYGEYILPSCARNDPEYDNLYWRGAIWGPMNFLVYMGVKNYSNEAAAELSEKSYQMFINAWRRHGKVLENIHAEKGTDKLEEQVNADLFYHWGALMGLMKFMEEGYYSKP
ncbi:MAG: hypothetical protein HC819_07075 [Cyclobacteriaceae bacterium]|nr:hypothetical protein [Cyclobacteriaceae bacterium]